MDSSSRWFMNTAMGVNPLKSMMPKISELAGLSTRYTNHSLRATSATRMFSAGVPEKIIAERTRHRSAKALRQYEHTSTAQMQAAGFAVSEEKPFGSAVSEEKPICSENSVPKVEMQGSGKVKEKSSPPASPLKDKLNKMLPTFGGSMNNCTINITL